ncbi:winged helix-turn-helix transcriptional regulator [Mycolicibacterium flavescens]|uniref:MarR family transcriptional regulator n=1 Tax=Mycolicibacterium flavescens TaxID=1776 RepID=A0A1E3RF77_MYCFV|nr:MarR family winged helix-turn-helix transcriptional regulator [Mycolicibacterium flavescens]MCV7278753.1 winged helix-turn-helix transcriptional regulator [Mycolicibacterium flavescens]ODQ88499.1 MarR family transcriptional regulator [Mycolicibacterium flavescens]
MYSVWLTAQQQQVWRKYLAATSLLQTAMHRQLQQDCELSLADYDVLVALSERGEQRVNELADTLGWEQSRLSHQIRRMRGRGLVQRRDSGDDRRGASVSLTDGGRTTLEKAAAGHVELVRTTVFEGLSPTQLEAFGEVLDAMLGRLAG